MQRTFSPLLPIDILSHRAGMPRPVVCQKQNRPSGGFLFAERSPETWKKKRKSYCGRFQR
nr:MAG TPA: hypothetical protein [Caudoviricetes sp.]